MLVPVQFESHSRVMHDVNAYLRFPKDASPELHHGKRFKAYVYEVVPGSKSVHLSTSRQYALSRERRTLVSQSNMTPRPLDATDDRTHVQAQESAHLDEGASGAYFLNTLKPGTKLRGTIKAVIESGVFVECGVVRTGKAGRLTPVDGWLYRGDLKGILAFPASDSWAPHPDDHTLPGAEPGMELDVWVKQVSKQSGRLAVTTDEAWDKDAVQRSRRWKRVGKGQRKGNLVRGSAIRGVVKRVDDSAGHVTLSLGKGLEGHLDLRGAEVQLFHEGQVVDAIVEGIAGSGSVRLSSLPSSLQQEEERQRRTPSPLPVGGATSKDRDQARERVDGDAAGVGEVRGAAAAAAAKEEGEEAQIQASKRSPLSHILHFIQDEEEEARP